MIFTLIVDYLLDVIALDNVRAVFNYLEFSTEAEFRSKNCRENHESNALLTRRSRVRLACIDLLISHYGHEKNGNDLNFIRTMACKLTVMPTPKLQEELLVYRCGFKWVLSNNALMLFDAHLIG
jgi:hypothetical protein